MKRLSAKLMVVALLGAACGYEHAPTELSSTPPTGKVDASEVPFDVNDVIRRVRLSYRQEGESFLGYVQNLEVHAERGVITMTPRRWSDDAAGKVGAEMSMAEGAAISFETIAIERDRPHVLGHETFLGEDSSLRIDRKVAEERLVNRDTEVEQLWVFDREPEGNGDLRVLVGVDGQAYAGWDELGHHFMDEETGLGVRYGNATWIDGAGRSYGVPVEYEDGVLTIVVDAGIVQKSAYPAILDPVIGAEFNLTPPAAGTAAAFRQNAPSIAFDGTNYLVVWEDQRAGTSYDIYGARVTQANAVLDTGGILIGSALDDQRRPAVAFNGAVYLVVWGDNRASVNIDIFGGRVSTAGAVLDGVNGFQIAGAAGHQDDPAVGASGATFVVAWRDQRSGVDNVWATRVDSGGGVTPPGGFALEAGAALQSEPAVAASGTLALVAFTNRVGNNRRIRASRIDAGTGAVLGTTELTNSGTDVGPSAAYDGTNFLVVYQRENQGNLRDVNGVRVGSDGVALDPPAGIVISGVAGNQRFPAVAFRNGVYLVVWHDDRNAAVSGANIFATTVQPTGVVNQPNGFNVCTANGAQTLVTVAAGTTGWFAAWEDLRSGQTDVFGTALVNSGSPLNATGRAIALSSNRQVAPAVLFDDPFYFIAFSDSRNSGGANYDIIGVRVRVSGAISDPAGINLSLAAGDQTAPDLAYNPDDDELLVVWADQRAGNHDVYGRLINTNYQLQPERVLAMGNQTQQGPRAAYNAAVGRYLVAWQDNRNGNFDVFAARIDNVTGTVVDAGGRPVIVAAGDQRAPDVASDGLNWLVVWHDERNGATEDDIRGALVNFANTVTVPDIALDTDAGEQSAPRIEFDGTNYVMVYSDDPLGLGGTTDVSAVRVTTGGAVIDQIVIANDPNLDEFRPGFAIVPSATFGNTWTIVWMQDDGPGSNDTDLFGRQFDTNGVPLDAAFVISQNAGNEDQPVVTAGRLDRAIVVYSRFTAAANVNQERVYSRLLAFP